jgi:Zn finger protein HypA/HybF involved in hydrogenase expression
MRLSDGLATRFCFDQIETQKRAANQRFWVSRFLQGIRCRHRKKELRNEDLRLLCGLRAMLTSSLTPKTGL